MLSGDHLRLVTARSAFALLARTLNPPAVWLPSYLCGVVLDAFANPGMQVRFYPVDQDLQISGDHWLTELHTGHMVVFIDYFGFNTWNQYGNEAKARGTWVVEDACQAFLNSSFSEYADYVIASPRKFIGVPDGGLLLAQHGTALPVANLPPPPASWWLDALKASQLRAEFDRHGGNRQWFDLFSRTEPAGPVEPGRMSELSSLLLDHFQPYDDVSTTRCRNFRQLANALPDFAMFRELPDGTIPLGFPIRVHNRDHVRRALFNCEIYPPVHWIIQGVVPDEFQASHQLAGTIMTLPCDQRCSPDDIERMIREFRASRPVAILPQ